MLNFQQTSTFAGEIIRRHTSNMGRFEKNAIYHKALRGSQVENTWKFLIFHSNFWHLLELLDFFLNLPYKWDNSSQNRPGNWNIAVDSNNKQRQEDTDEKGKVWKLRHLWINSFVENKWKQKLKFTRAENSMTCLPEFSKYFFFQKVKSF